MNLLGVIGGQEILIIALIVLVLFGGKKIPELMKGLGKGVKEYKKAMNGVEEEVNGHTPQSLRDSSQISGQARNEAGEQPQPTDAKEEA